MPGFAISAQPSGGPPGGAGGDWDGDEWDLAESLTAAEVAALDALDRAASAVDSWGDDPGDGAPVDADAWRDGTWSLDGELYSPQGPACHRDRIRRACSRPRVREGRTRAAADETRRPRWGSRAAASAGNRCVACRYQPGLAGDR